MKKGLIVFLFVFVVLGSCATNDMERVAMNPVYSTFEGTRESIDGSLHYTRLIIARDKVERSHNDNLTLDRFTHNNLTVYNITLQLGGYSWRFYDELKIKIDNGEVITLKDSNPNRVVEGAYSTGVWVTEYVNFILDNELVQSLKNCTNLMFQYGSKLKTIPPEGINAIKNFIQ